MKKFNITGLCVPNRHYMVDISSRVKEIYHMVDEGDYFTIHRARQYGKTTILTALAKALTKDYLVVNMDFQALGNDSFQKETIFSLTFANYFIEVIEWSYPHLSKELEQTLESLKQAINQKPELFTLYELFQYLTAICKASLRPIVLIIDEVDSASNHQVFLDFLAQLRNYYLKRNAMEFPAFQSVILAGVYDIRNLKRKLRPEDDHTGNSPWNIAADFTISMEFNQDDIIGMLKEYESDYHTGMDITKISSLLYEYTSGYPFLVSKLCKLMDEQIETQEELLDKTAIWKKEGFLKAVKLLLNEKNTLFESLINKLTDYPKMREMMISLLFQGNKIAYHPFNKLIETAEMFGFIKNNNGNIIISNRIFEMALYNLFLSEEMINSILSKEALQDKNLFIQNGHLNMKLVLERFVTHFDDLYGDQGQKFYEEDGRRYFLLYLMPIINGVGNYYIEAQTRNMERTDIIIDYRGEQFIIEMKIWRGNAYHLRGETQLLDYLNYYHLKKGYMLSFNFNKTKDIGIKEISFGDKILIEAVV